MDRDKEFEKEWDRVTIKINQKMQEIYKFIDDKLDDFNDLEHICYNVVAIEKHKFFLDQMAKESESHHELIEFIQELIKAGKLNHFQ